MTKLQEFIKKSKSIHGNKYDYSQVVYSNNRTKVKIICPIHGEFWQMPYNHLMNKGCLDCSRQVSSQCINKNKNEFIDKATIFHKGKYDYSQIDYKNCKTKVKIICPIHGEFWQIPSNHCKYGCNNCAYTKKSKAQARTIKEFLEKAKIIHKDTYDYSKVEYTHCHAKIEIICKKHGSFFQTANSHLRGRGCKECKKGEGHPKYGKPSKSSGWYGKYRGNVFRSLPELFWMVSADKNSIEFIGLDQLPNREIWQVPVNYTGSNRTYCADFFIKSTNEVIDIKPLWKIPLENEKLRQGKKEYEKRGYIFKIIDAKTIPISTKLLKNMVKNGTVILFPSAIKRYEKRFGPIP